MQRQQAGDLGSAVGMSRLLHPVASQQRLLLVLASSTGGSEVNPGSRDYVVAGLQGTSEQWRQFEIARGRDATDLWGASPRTEHCQASRGDPLASSIDTCGLIAIGSRLDGKAFEGLPPDLRRELTCGRPMEPAVLCFRQCLRMAAAQAKGFPSSERVSVVVDGEDDLSGQALWLIEEMKVLTTASARERLGALGFEPKQSFAPLQAAEWLSRALLPAPRQDFPLELQGWHPSRLLFKPFDPQALRRLEERWEKQQSRRDRHNTGV